MWGKEARAKSEAYDVQTCTHHTRMVIGQM